MQQPPARPLIAEIEQLRRSVDSMNSQTAEMLKNLENLRHIGADHIALPSTEQEKLDREWEYFETVCDQVYFILENAKYKLRRQQDALSQQLNPPAPQEKPATPDETIAPSAVVDTATEIGVSALVTATAEQPAIKESAAFAAIQEDAALTLTPTVTTEPIQDSSTFDLEMLSPQTNFDALASTSSGRVSTASLLSAASVVSEPDTSMIDESLVSEEDKLQDTMLDLGDIGNLGDNLGDMDDMINF